MKRNLTIPAVFTAVFTLILCTATLSGCFSDWTGDEATITINLGAGPNARLAYPPEEDDGIPPKLEHRIKLQGPTGTINLSRTGAGPVTASVAPGNWEITVEDWYQGKQLYATGSGRVTVIGGKNNPVTIEMRRYIVAYSAIQDGGASGTDDSTGIVFTFSTNIDSFGLSADDIDVSGAAEKGAATLTGSGTTWTLSPITVTDAGLATVLIERDGIEAGTKTVIVHRQGQTTPECWNITWNLDGGTEGAGAQHPTLIEKGTVLNRPDPDPVKTGYIFDGWYRDVARTQGYTFSSPVTEDLTLHAKWIAANYDINLSLSHKGVSFDPSELFSFPVDAVGYATQTPLEATVRNTGDQATGALTATLGSTNAASFALTGASIADIPVGATTETFTVAPIGGLGAGTYTATVTVSSNANSISASFEVSFTVFDLGSTDDLEFEPITSGPNDNTYRVIGYEDNGLQAVVIPAYYREPGSDGPYLPVTEIGDLTNDYPPFAFSHATFTSVTIGENVTSIGYNAFQYCQALTSITIPSNVKTIGQRAFAQCSFMDDESPGLKNITISEGVTSIDWQAFYECNKLESITIPGSVTSIGNEAFANCSSLTSVTFGSGGVGIGTGAFPNGFFPNFGDQLKNAYGDDGAGTYTRTAGGSQWAKQIGVDINGMTAVGDIQTAISAQLSDGNVYVTGTVTGADTTLNLNIPLGRVIIWGADYSGEEDVQISGSGDFVLAPGGKITSSAPSAYMVSSGGGFDGHIIVRGAITATSGAHGIGSSTSATIIIDGGIITTGGNAIQVYGSGPKVIIRSGTLETTGDGPAIGVAQDAKLAIFGGSISAPASITQGIVNASGTSTVYMAGGIIDDGGIKNGGDTPTGYYAPGFGGKFSGFTDGTDLLEDEPSPTWW